MSAIKKNFDSHQFVKEITDAGLPVGQSEIFAAILSEISNNRYVTTEDIIDLKNTFKNDLNNLKVSINENITKDFKILEFSLIIKFGIALISSSITTIGILSTLYHFFK